ncbi:hypothetical protein [Sorangium sp. So ce426]|uniref:hypothetical protein n=1 Tax=Sorangium sp. So ce426 TaxID=3133312 RepID=UPI003F5B8814
MHKTREILRQKWLLGRTHRQTATSNGTSPGAVGSVLARAKAAGLTTWEQVTQLDDEALDRALYGTSVAMPGVAPTEPDCAWIHLRRPSTHRPREHPWPRRLPQLMENDVLTEPTLEKLKSLHL